MVQVVEVAGDRGRRRKRVLVKIIGDELPHTEDNSEALTHSLPLVSASRVNPSMSLAPLRLHSRAGEVDKV